jgi:hypothetical protein
MIATLATSKKKEKKESLSLILSNLFKKPFKHV